jgi:hypothetical protein
LAVLFIVALDAGGVCPVLLFRRSGLLALQLGAQGFRLKSIMFPLSFQSLDKLLNIGG